MKQNKTFIVAGAVILIILISSPIFLLALSKSDSKKVNGTHLTVSQEEYDFFERKERAQVSSYFHNTYDAPTDDEKFWETEYNNEIPEEMLRNKTTYEIAKVKSVVTLAKQYGLEYPENLDALKKENKRYNQKRKKKLELGEVIYGPTELSLDEYFLYTFNELEDDLKQELRENHFDFSEETLQTYYDTLDKEQFHKGYEGKVDFYFIDETCCENESHQKNMFEVITNLVGQDKRVDIKKLRDEFDVPLNKETIDIDMTNISRDDDMLLQILNVVSKTDLGELSNVEKVGPYIGVIHVREKEDLGFSEFEDNKELIAREYLNIQFEELIEDMISETQVDILD